MLGTFSTCTKVRYVLPDAAARHTAHGRYSLHVATARETTAMSEAARHG